MASLGHVFLDELASRSFCLFVSTMRLGTLPPNHPFVLFVYMNTYTHTLYFFCFLISEVPEVSGSPIHILGMSVPTAASAAPIL